ncbi:DUF1206 domain-containing protein [Microbacterium invictum]|nr:MULTISPECIES: DUF1206 domain-containing protein [Microbacterium]
MKAAAREAQSSTPVRVLARGGFAANGVVHLVIGIIVLVIAFGGRGESDQAGAFKAIAAAPLGYVALWLLAVLLAALGVWHLIDGLLADRGRRDSDTKKWGARISSWGQALVFLTLAVIAAAVALGARPDADDSATEASRGVLTLPFGALLLGAVGVGIGVAGIVFGVMGVRRSFRNRVTIPAGGLGTVVTTLGVVGFVAKGVALLIVGVLLIVAAVRVDPEAAGGLDAAIQALLDVTGGPFLVGLVGAGLIAYAVFCFFRARYARL